MTASESTGIYSCCTQARRNAVLASALNGIDFLELLDASTIPGSPAQQTLLVHLVKPVPPGLLRTNVLITGGESILNIKALWVAQASTLVAAPEGTQGPTAAEATKLSALPDAANILVVRTSSAGDFAPYTLRLVKDATSAASSPFSFADTLPGIDPQLAAITFRFKSECAPTFDCEPASTDCPADLRLPPPINYLAKDYGSFRTILLDRLSQLLPGWSASSEADLGVVLAELLAYAGDRLSYWQDAIATEAYLQTARSRISLRRHALLVDYTVHDGANARTLMQVQVSSPPGTPVALDRTQTRFYTYAPGMPVSLGVGLNNEEAAIRAGVQVFEPMMDATLFAEHNLIHFYTWGESNCCLPAGATECTLAGTLPNLKIGDILIFEEVIGPQTGFPADADIRNRCAVRLTAVTTIKDPLFTASGEAIPDGSELAPASLVEVQWAAADALARPVCLSSSWLDSSGNPQTSTNVSVAYGNVVLADHGLCMTGMDLPDVPQPSIYQPAVAPDRCHPTALSSVSVRYNPVVLDSPLTQAVPLSDATALTLSATDLLTFDPSKALPVIRLRGTTVALKQKWTPVQDLLESGPEDLEFVVEIETDGTAKLRFGNNSNGAFPASGTTFTADYRVGNGTAGNVGADSLRFLSSNNAHLQTCRNPLPAQGGFDPETPNQIRRRAPQAFVTQERAVSLTDYQSVAQTSPVVERAVASSRWTGSWHTVFLAVEPMGNTALTPPMRSSVLQYLDRYRLAGQDVDVDAPQYLPLEISLSVCVDPAYFRAQVLAGLTAVLGNGQLSNGTRGLFFPDSFTFGQTVYLSRVYAAARSVPGVQTVTATVFQPMGYPAGGYLSQGEIPVGPLQIAQLDNDPSLPNHGTLTLTLMGGK